MKPKLKPPGIKRLQLKCGYTSFRKIHRHFTAFHRQYQLVRVLLSTSAFRFNLRRYIVVLAGLGSSEGMVFCELKNKNSAATEMLASPGHAAAGNKAYFHGGFKVWDDGRAAQIASIKTCVETVFGIGA
jgi:hypothetical protein